ncbi:MAG: co-chaperone GroES [Ignavibacteriaceae bacterium]|jgi:chaperonin GroES
MQYEPLYDKIIAKEIKQPQYQQETQGGIFIPETASEKPFLAEVIAAGSGMLTNDGNVIPLKVKPGDKVVYNTASQSVQPFKDGIEEFILMREVDIWAVVREPVPATDTVSA